VIKVAVYRSVGSALKLVGWDELDSGTVGGQDIREMDAMDTSGLSLLAVSTPAHAAAAAYDSSAAAVSGVSELALEALELTDGQPCLRLSGLPDREYVIEVGDETEEGVHWEPYWIGTLPGGELVIPVAGGTQFRALTR
jgi:hypothetical protein